MDGELVTDPESEEDDDDDEGGTPQSPPSTFSERFHEAFPFYLAIGMTPEQYWDGDAELTRAYRKAYEIKKRQTNHDLWLQGMYVYEAIADCSPIYNFWSKKREKPHPYPSEPYAITASERRERREREERKKMRDIRRRLKTRMKQWNEFFKKGGTSDGRS